MNKLALMLALGLTSYNTVASNNVYDTDSNAGRVTTFYNAPIDAMVTQSTSAYNVRIYTPHFTNRRPCQSAAVYDQNTDALISVLNVDFQILTGTIEKGHEYKEKYVEATCTDELGNRQTLRHKLAPVPKVTFNSQLNVANWVDSDGFNPGYFQDVAYQAQLNLDNGEPNGYCRFANLVGETPKLLSERHQFGLYSDVISVSGAAKYDARANVLVTEVICKGTGGATHAVEVWHINEQQQRREISVEIF
ncbi:hypothetical protein HG263_14170 [Pseudoalteromonas sp. JBTF-M23]|uniref:Uncharacterized protein n=1 Tax=Pseudoalteromonas caenipelagi TaxID=2726988 RepID=A0A849VG21_9GAMM|nr:hypothetical protein [Pseudoalteromonas caenipelagi]NOU51678.1 hypothetical protein [Pseudoalteromonas caenipelagi]